MNRLLGIKSGSEDGDVVYRLSHLIVVILVSTLYLQFDSDWTGPLVKRIVILCLKMQPDRCTRIDINPPVQECSLLE